MTDSEGAPIDDADAYRLCEEVRARNRWYTPGGMWCWGCTTFTRGDASQRCYHAAPGNRGCAQVNRSADSRTE